MSVVKSIYIQIIGQFILSNIFQDIADPFYAYCKLHAEKTTMRAKRRNYLAIQSHIRNHAENESIQDEKEKVFGGKRGLYMSYFF